MHKGASRYVGLGLLTMPKSSAAATPTLREFLLSAEKLFLNAQLYFGHGTDNARDEAAWLTCSALAIAFDALQAHAERKLTASEFKTLSELTEARVRTRKPLAYLLHEAWFAGLKFYVDERVLVPRSLIGDFMHEQFQPWVNAARVERILDLCTGSGCIGIAAARAFPQAQVDVSDISTDALDVAGINIHQHSLVERVHPIQSDLFQGLADRRYDLIITNPPYVDAADMASLPEEYRHEPALALASGERGLNTIVRILAQAPRHLNPDGVLIAEVGNSCTLLQQTFAQVPFMWMTCASGDESVFMLTAAQLNRHANSFAAALAG